jgi:hypothetical protein
VPVIKTHVPSQQPLTPRSQTQATASRFPSRGLFRLDSSQILHDATRVCICSNCNVRIDGNLKVKFADAHKNVGGEYEVARSVDCWQTFFRIILSVWSDQNPTELVSVVIGPSHYAFLNENSAKAQFRRNPSGAQLEGVCLNLSALRQSAKVLTDRQIVALRISESTKLPSRQPRRRARGRCPARYGMTELQLNERKQPSFISSQRPGVAGTALTTTLSLGRRPHRLFHFRLHLLWGHRNFWRPKGPFVAEWVGDDSISIAPEHVGCWHDDRGSG